MNRSQLVPMALVALSLLGSAALAQPPAAGDGGAFERARTAYKKGDIDTARTEMEKAIAALPEDADANAWMGFLLVKTQDFVRAIPFLEKAIAKKETVEVCTNLGTALLQKPDRTAAETARAVSLFEKVVEKRPSAAEGYFNLGYARARRADYDGAATAYRRATELNPGDGQAFINLGLALQQKGRWDEAGAALRAGIAKLPGDRTGLAALGAVELKRGDYPAAISALETARKVGENSYAVLTSLAFAYSKTGRERDAATTYGAAADMVDAGEPGVKKDAAARYNQGVMLAKTGDMEGALTAYEKALVIDPKFFDALLNSGYSLFRMGKFPDAATRFKTAAEVNPNSAIAWVNLGTAAFKIKDSNGAIRAWQKACQLDASDYSTREYLAGALMSETQEEEALKVYTEMNALKPAAALPLNGMGLAAMKLNRLDQAQKSFQAAIQAEPGFAQAYNNLGVVLERRGQLNEAIANYKRALELDPKLKDAKENLARFGKMADNVKPAPQPDAKPVKAAPPTRKPKTRRGR